MEVLIKMAIIPAREKLNKYDEDTLKRLKELNLVLLKEFIRICEDNDIEYFLDGGSAIGAVRHQGFIPWDDDMDIILFRDQYDKFMEVMKNYKEDKFELISSTTKRDYVRWYSLFSLKGTKAGVYYDRNTDFTVGIALDIFVLDNIPDNVIRRGIFKIRWYILKKIIWLYEIANGDAYISKNKEKIGRFSRKLFKLFNINFSKLKRWGNNFINDYRDEKTDYVTNLSTTYELEAFPKELFRPPKKVLFENIEVNIPHDYDTYLKMIYGEYKEVPPVEERYNHFYNIVDFGKYK